MREPNIQEFIKVLKRGKASYVPLAELGVHPIEPKAMEIEDVKEKYGDKLSLIGSVDLLARDSVEEIVERAYYNIEKAGYNGGYILGSGNSIPDYVNYGNYLALLKISQEYKY